MDNEINGEKLSPTEFELFDSASPSERRNCEKHGVYLAKFPKIPSNQCEECGTEMIGEINRLAIAEHKKNNRIARTEALLSHSVIPKRSLGATLRDIPAGASKKHLDVIERMRKLVQNFEKVKSLGTSAYLHGRPGTGKTWLGCAVVLELVWQERQAVYTTQSELGSLARESHRDQENESERKLISRFVDYDFLVIDELGSGKNSEAERKTIAEILISRHENQSPTLVFSNLDALNVKLQFGDRLAERIATWIDIPCDWENHRVPAEGVF